LIKFGFLDCVIGSLGNQNVNFDFFSKYIFVERKVELELASRGDYRNIFEKEEIVVWIDIS